MRNIKAEVQLIEDKAAGGDENDYSALRQAVEAIIASLDTSGGKNLETVASLRKLLAALSSVATFKAYLASKKP